MTDDLTPSIDALQRELDITKSLLTKVVAALIHNSTLSAALWNDIQQDLLRVSEEGLDPPALDEIKKLVEAHRVELIRRDAALK